MHEGENEEGHMGKVGVATFLWIWANIMWRTQLGAPQKVGPPDLQKKWQHTFAMHVTFFILPSSSSSSSLPCHFDHPILHYLLLNLFYLLYNW